VLISGFEVSCGWCFLHASTALARFLALPLACAGMTTVCICASACAFTIMGVDQAKV
jgi:hypothetical protein